MKEIVYILQGYEEMFADGVLKNSCTIEVFAKTEEEALARAKSLIKKSNYRITHIIEK